LGVDIDPHPDRAGAGSVGQCCPKTDPALGLDREAAAIGPHTPRGVL